MMKECGLILAPLSYTFLQLKIKSNLASHYFYKSKLV